MKTYRLEIKPQSSFLTPWQADTIFGSLCWIMAWRDGEETLKQFLEGYKNDNPVFVLSDGMPGNLLPAPMHLPLMTKQGDSLEDYQKGKNLKKILFLTPDELQAVCNGEVEIQQKDGMKTLKTFTTLHSSINRISGTTGDEGSLFELEEYAVESKLGIISIYLKIRDGWEEKVFSLFKDLSLMGYGRKKSIGKGSFEIIGELEPFNKFDNLEGANGFISLSNFVPAKTDPIDGFYKTFVKYGKLGGEFTFSGKPFKKPLMMIGAGSSFYVAGSIKPFYGRIIEGIAPAKPEVVHYGYTFAVPAIINV
ncbi:MAG: RAMP superfamily CRISPR-associated protein [Nitrospirota bacterium]